MTYQRSMSETILDSNRQAMFVWEQAGAADASHARFHVLGRMYSYASLSDLRTAISDVLRDIDNYRSDMANGHIDEKGVETAVGRLARMEPAAGLDDISDEAVVK